jgi:hypothetical protein
MVDSAMEIGRLKSCGIVALLLFAGVYTCAHQVLEHRAEYPGGVRFEGFARNTFGSRYMRATWRRPYPETTPLPDVSLHVNGRAYKLSELTKDLLGEFGGGRTSVRLIDARGIRFSYRFEDERLMSFALESLGRPKGPEERDVEAVSLSIGDGQPFIVPITSGELRRRAGRPKRTYIKFVQ